MGPHCTAPTKTASQNILPELRLAGRHRERDRLSLPAVSSTKLTQTPADMSYSGVVWQFLKLLQDLSPFFQARELYPCARRHIMGMARLIKHSTLGLLKIPKVCVAMPEVSGAREGLTSPLLHHFAFCAAFGTAAAQLASNTFGREFQQCMPEEYAPPACKHRNNPIPSSWGHEHIYSGRRIAAAMIRCRCQAMVGT